ncbi:MAG: TniQ family protein, partial [Nitrososphaera sp.]
MGLPEHPPPCKDESLFSWIVRLAYLNRSSSTTHFLKDCFDNNTNWNRKDLDLLPDDKRKR